MQTLALKFSFVFSSLVGILADLDINATLYNIVTAFGAFVGGASALAFLYAGFLWMFSDDSQQRGTARRVFNGAIVGAVLALGAVTLAKIIVASAVNN